MALNSEFRIGWRSHAVALPILVLVHLLLPMDRFLIEHRLASLVLAVGCYFVVAWDVGRQLRAMRLPFLSFVALYYYVFFAAALLWQDSLESVDGPVALTDGDVLLAQFAVMASFASFIAGSGVGGLVGRLTEGAVSRALPEGPLTLGFKGVIGAALGASLVLSATVALGRGVVPGAVEFVAVVVLAPALPLTVLAWHAERTGEFGARVLLVVAVALFMGVGLLSGMLGAALTPLLVPVLARIVVRRRLAWWWVVAGVGAFVLLQPAKLLFRETVGQGQFSGGSSVEGRLSIWSAAVEETVEGEGASAQGGREAGFVARSMSRTAELLPIAQAIAWVPNRVPYTNGSQWFAALVGWIPRFAWPEKPDYGFESRSRYALEFRLQTETGVRTSSANISQVADGYWAFGWTGVAFAGLFFGLIVGWMAWVFPVDRWASYAVGSHLLLLGGYHSDIGGFVSGLPQRLVGAFLWCWVLAFALAAVRGSTRPT